MNYKGDLRSKFSWPDDKPVALNGAKNLFHASGASSYADLGKNADGKKLSVTLMGRQLVGMIDGRVHKKFDLDKLEPNAAPSPAPPSFEWSISGREFSIIIISAHWETHPDGTRETDGVTFLVLEK